MRSIELDIAELSPGGDGVGICELDGERRAVFVAGVAPGERALVSVDATRRPARGTLLRVLIPTDARASPVCAYVERCGGCDWMHLTPDAQRVQHAAIVGKLLGVAPTSHPAPRTVGYRSRARVHIEAKRGRVTAGMFARRSHELAAVESCIVLDPALDRARAQLAEWLDGARGRGEAQLALGRLATEGHPRGAVVDLRWEGELPPAVFGRLDRAVTTGALVGARVFAGDVRIPAKIGDPSPFVLAADGLPLRLAPGGFSQATEEGNLLLARRVAELASSLGPTSTVELYAGAGNLTVLLAKDRALTAVEFDHDACIAARENLAARKITARVVEGDAALFEIPKATSLVVLDPPREGARAVCEALAARAGKGRPPAVLYVSCDPPTLARDVRTLSAAGWELREVETFEMFPHTSHVETVAVLVRPASSRAA